METTKEAMATMMISCRVHKSRRDAFICEARLIDGLLGDLQAAQI